MCLEVLAQLADNAPSSTDREANGLTDVVSLLEDHEIRELELTREAELVRQAGLDFEKFPIPDRGFRLRTNWPMISGIASNRSSVVGAV
jgi:hypothetical protein